MRSKCARLCFTEASHGPLQRSLDGPRTKPRFIRQTVRPSCQSTAAGAASSKQTLPSWSCQKGRHARAGERRHSAEINEALSRVGPRCRGSKRPQLRDSLTPLRQTHPRCGTDPSNVRVERPRDAANRAPACTCEAMGTPVLCASAARSAPTIVRRLCHQCMSRQRSTQRQINATTAASARAPKKMGTLVQCTHMPQ